MAFKNLLAPNIATACMFQGTTYGFGGWGAVTLTPLSGKKNGVLDSLRVDLGSGGGYLYMPNALPNSGEDYAIQSKIWAENGLNITLSDGTSNFGGLTGNNDWQDLQGSKNVGSTWLYVGKWDVQGTFYITMIQAELGLTFTDWQFPGVDLTGQSITSQEQVNNLTVENIIDLIGIPSTEVVNNLTLIQEIVLDAIESTTTVHNLIPYIQAELIRANIHMEVPRSVVSMKSPRSKVTMRR